MAPLTTTTKLRKKHEEREIRWQRFFKISWITDALEWTSTKNKIRVDLSTLKVKQPVTLPTKWLYSGIGEELQFGTHKLWQTIGKSGDQRTGKLVYREKEEIGKGCLESKSIGGKQEIKGVRISYEMLTVELWYFLIG